MITLYMLRHGVAVERRGGDESDEDSRRLLTEQGERKVRRIAERLEELGVVVDVLLSSPFLRAHRTAEIVAEVLGIRRKLAVCEALAVGGDTRELITFLNERCASHKRVMLVGHEPYLTDLASVLVSGRPGLPLKLKKGGLIKLRAEHLRLGRCAMLEWLLPPRVLAHLGPS